MSTVKLSQRETEALELFMKLGNKTHVAKEMGLSRRRVRGLLENIEAKGQAPWLSPAFKPEHMDLQKTTVQYNGAGEVIQEWRRLIPAAQDMEAFVEGLCERVKGKAKVPKRKAKKSDDKNLLAELSVFDLHMGMYAQAEETLGKDYDCSVAAKNIINVSDQLLDRFVNPSHVVISFGGDQNHADGRIPATEKSHNILDVDTRFDTVVDNLLTTSYDLVSMAADRIPKVTVVVVPGNHDPNSSVWFARCLSAFYYSCPNVNVVLQKSAIKNMVWGNNLLVWAHGQDIPLKRWGEVIPNTFRETWGKTQFCHVKTGHVHHRRGKKTSVITQQEEGWVEQAGVLAESLPASCFRDGWHASKGFYGQMVGVAGFEYHKTHGLWSRLYQPIL